MKALPSFLKGTIQFINELNNLFVETGSLLITVDVKSFYTCIPHDKDIQACADALWISKENNSHQLTTKTLINLLEIVLKNNTFEFDDKCFLCQHFYEQTGTINTHFYHPKTNTLQKVYM